MTPKRVTADQSVWVGMIRGGSKWFRCRCRCFFFQLAERGPGLYRQFVCEECGVKYEDFAGYGEMVPTT